MHSFDHLTGEIAAIGTALFFAVSSTLFAAAGRRAGASKVNRSRLLVAALLAVAIYWVMHGHPLPTGLSSSAWMWLALSGVIGLALGDESLFRAYVLIGPALSMLIFALAPAIAACLSWLLFGEALTMLEIFGIALTLAGIAWVVTAPKRPVSATAPGAYALGLVLALGGALGQALGLITAKVGLTQGASPQAANTIRLIAAAVVIWLVTVLSGRMKQSLSIWSEHPRAAVFTVCGAGMGPIVGVWLSLIAINRAPIGVASTLMSLTPLFLLPIGRVVFHEPITLRALAGTVVALAGVGVLLR